MDAAKKGSTDLLVLALLDEGDLHGYDLGRRIEQRSRGALSFTLASLYETLYRLEERRLRRRPARRRGTAATAPRAAARQRRSRGWPGSTASW